MSSILLRCASPAAPGASPPFPFSWRTKTRIVSTGTAYFDTRLKLVPLEDNGAGTLVPKEKNGSTVILDPAQVPDYFDNIHSTPGLDSEHPDESPAYKFVSHVSPAGDAPPARDLTEDFKLWTRDGKS